MSSVAAIHLAQGRWPNLKQLHLFEKQLSEEAAALLVKGE